MPCAFIIFNLFPVSFGKMSYICMFAKSSSNQVQDVVVFILRNLCELLVLRCPWSWTKMLHPILEKKYLKYILPTYEQTCFYLQILALHQYSPLKVLGSQLVFSTGNILVNICVYIFTSELCARKIITLIAFNFFSWFRFQKLLYETLLSYCPQFSDIGTSGCIAVDYVLIKR